MSRYQDDYRYGQESRDRDLQIIWRCSSCGSERHDTPGYNEGGEHYGCGGDWVEAGESYEVGR
jgi:hypothetical protein